MHANRSRTVRGLVLISWLALLASGYGLSQAQSIRWLTTQSLEENANALIERFNEAHPEIDVTLDVSPWQGYEERVQVALRGGNPPDLIDVPNPWNAPFASLGLLQPLDPLLWDEFDRADYFDAFLETAIVDDQIYGLPFRAEAIAMIYNEDLLAEAGLPVRAPQTWDELLEFSEALTKDTNGDGLIDQYGWGAVGFNTSNVVLRIAPFVWQNGGDLLNEDNTQCMLDEPEAAEAVQFYADLYAEHGVAPEGTMSSNASDVDQLFANGVVALHMTGPWVHGTYSEQPELNYGTAILPARDENSGDHSAAVGGWNIVMPAQADNVEAATVFLEFFAQPDNVAQYTTSLPPHREATLHERFAAPGLEGFVSQLDHTRPLPSIPQWTQVQQIIYEQVQRVMYGQLDASEAMQDACSQIDRILAQN